MKSIRNIMYGINAPVRLNNGQVSPAINLDNAATTPAFTLVLDEIKKQLLYYGSIGRGRGQKSQHSTDIYTNGRELVKDFLGADERYLTVYTNSTTDGINKLASALIKNVDDLVLTTRMEHHANDLPWRERCQVVYAEVDELGRLVMADFERLLVKYQGAIKYVAVLAASNVSGYVNDVHAIAKIAHQHGAKIIVDGAQIVAHQEFKLVGEAPDEFIDFFAFSAHKMYSPFGGGAIVGLADDLAPHLPHFYGGGMVDAVGDTAVNYLSAPDSYEAGTANYVGVVGMLTAMQILTTIGFWQIRQHEQKLLRLTIAALKQMPQVILYADNDNLDDRIGIITFNIKGCAPAVVANQLADDYGIATRHAAFCAHPYVRRLTGEPEGEADLLTSPEGMVRISFGIYNDETDIIDFLAAIEAIIKNTLKGSPVIAL